LHDGGLLAPKLAPRRRLTEEAVLVNTTLGLAGGTQILTAVRSARGRNRATPAMRINRDGRAQWEE